MYYGLQGNYFDNNDNVSDSRNLAAVGQGLQLGSNILSIFDTSSQADSINSYYTQINRGLQTFNGQIDLLNSNTKFTLQQIQTQQDIANTNAEIKQNKSLSKQIVNFQPNNASIYFAMRDTSNNTINQRFINDAQASSATLSMLYQKSSQLNNAEQKLNSLFNANEKAKQSQEQLNNQQLGNIINTGISAAMLAAFL